ncbi:glycerate kinase [Actinotalea sp. K2]|uniref:glycerate kinase family protein n=1 Tax=Actinotalea sp. K2 TaxID=2939438 RepID=UPI002017D402|nr:glycerate kinase [Actinotalea sp. K2]MCL3860731.1 glycerate kinase [Actinotalea sp. K2]
MRILVAPDCFTGTLSAQQAAEAMGAGWADGAPHDEVTALPLADGGPGFVDTVHGGLGGELVPTTVTGPLGGQVPAVILLVPSPHGPVAYLESAQAVGLHLVPDGQRDPTRTTSVGVGEMLRTALGLGARRVVVGLGGSATNDGGAGLLAGLGLRGDLLRAGGGTLGHLAPEDLADLAALRRELAAVDLVVACDVDVPLLGLHGASGGFAAQKGATPEQAQHLERQLGHFAHLVDAVVSADTLRRDLLAAPPPGVGAARGGAGRALAQLAGAGAAGGLGFALAVLGGRLLAGSDVVADAIGLSSAIAQADLVVTGEGSFDWQSLHGKAVSAVASRGLTHGVPVVVVAGQVLIGRREWGAAGVAGAYAVAEDPHDLDHAMADPAGTLRARVARVARTWSR